MSAALAAGMAAISVFYLAAPPASGDTVVLKDGSVIEGTIVDESTTRVRIETKFGTRTFERKSIERLIKERVEESAVWAIRNLKTFSELPDLARDLKNAQALYDLGRFDEIPPLVEPLVGKGTLIDDMHIRWLLIEVCERQGQWEEAERLLKKTLEDGREPDKIRAQVHLDIFEENPGHTLRKVRGKRTAEFLDREMRNRGKAPNALQDPELMSAALREYMNQILRDEKVSVSALHERMDRTETVDAIKGVLEDERSIKSQSVVDALPYLDALEDVERSLYKAKAIIPGAARGFEIDLVRAEADHLESVISELLGDLSRAYPGDKDPGADPATGRMSKEARERWREMCDEFLALSKPVEELIRYLLRRVGAYPDELRPFIKEWEDTLERVEQMQQNTARNRDRARV